MKRPDSSGMEVKGIANTSRNTFKATMKTRVGTYRNENASQKEIGLYLSQLRCMDD